MLMFKHITPVMLIDSTGLSPEWHHWLRSGLAVSIGIALVATGVFTPIGGALIGMGINSMVSGYKSESDNGTFDSGYYGGALTGFLCGGTAALGGGMISAAGEAGTFLGLIGGVTLSAAGGFAGGYLGTAYTDMNNTGQVNQDNAMISGGVCGVFNMFAGVRSAITTQLSYAGQRGVVGFVAFSFEGIIDGVAFIIDEIHESIN